MYGRTPSPEIMNHFSSLCFGLCLGVDQFNKSISILLNMLIDLSFENMLMLKRNTYINNFNCASNMNILRNKVKLGFK